MPALIYDTILRSLRRRSRLILAMFLGLTLPGCSSGLHLINLLVPDDSYRLEEGVAYGSLPRQKLDVYRPVGSDGNGAAIVFFYGGSWKNGERSQYRFVGEALARRGHVVVIPDYRVYPEVQFPVFMEDAAKAVRWTAENAVPSGVGPARIAVGGHSAGAHMAALLATDGRYLKEEGMEPGSLCGVFGLAGPYGFDPLEYESTRPAFATLTDTDAARPVAQVSVNLPPFLLLHGTDDTTVVPRNTEAMTEALESHGIPVNVQMIPDIGHIWMLLAMARPFEGKAPINDMIDAFVRQCGRTARAAL